MLSIQSLALLSFASLALSSTFTSPDFQVTNLNTFEPSGRPGQVNLYRVGFNVTDPSDSAATFCETRWDYSVATTGYPSTWLANCTDPGWAFKFDEYQNYYNSTLDVRHTSKKHGTKTTRFAKAPVTFDIIECAHAASGFSACIQKAGVVFSLPVYDVRKH